MPPALCCSAEDIVDANSTAVPNVRQPVLLSQNTSNAADEASNSVIHIKEITEIFASATAANNADCDHADTATTSSRATRQSKLHMIKKRFSRDSTTLKLAREKEHVQKKPLGHLPPKKSRLHITPSESDILAHRTPSHGGYDRDAHILEDGNISAAAHEAATEPSAVLPSTVPTEQIAFSKCSDDDDVFTPYPQSSSGAPRLPSITSASISMHWPTTPYSHRPAVLQNSATVAAIDEPFQEPRTSAQSSRTITHPESQIWTPNSTLDPITRSSELNEPLPMHDEQLVSELSADVEKHRDPLPRPRRPRPGPGLHAISATNHSESSLHLYTMRISQHLRSLSNLSTDSSAAGPNSNHSRIGSDVNEPLIDHGHAQRHLNRLSFVNHAPVNPPQGTAISNTALKLVPEIAIGKHGKKALALNSIVSMKHTLFQPLTPVSPEAPKYTQVVSTGESSKNYDGSPEQLLPAPDAQRPSQTETRTRQKSISENYDDAATLWGKALGAYADVAAERRRSSRSLSTSSRSRWNIAVQGVSRRPSLSPRKASTTSNQTVESQRARTRAGSVLTLKPLQTQHTFDKLAVSYQNPDDKSPNHDTDGTFSFPLGILHGRTRSKSHPHLVEKHSFSKRSNNTRRMVPNTDIDEGPSITITDTEVTQATKKMSKALARHRSGSSLAAWSRYPSHTRHERSFSAGMLDNVITRDFADTGSRTDDTSDDAVERQKTTKKMKTKTRIAGRRKKFLSDLPRLFKSHGIGNNKPARGHRSSIAAGAPLEFPELELIAGGGMPYNPADTVLRRDSATFDTGSPRAKLKSVMTVEASGVPNVEPGQQKPVELVRLGSSNYGSMGDHGIAQTDGNSFTDGPYDIASDWPSFYASAVDLPPIDPLDDNNGPLADKSRTDDVPAEAVSTLLFPRSARRNSPGAKSLPPTFAMSKTDEECVDLRTNRKKLRQSISAQPMRRSTQDLLTKLDSEEAAEMARALRTAETVWSS